MLEWNNKKDDKKKKKQRSPFAKIGIIIVLIIILLVIVNTLGHGLSNKKSGGKFNLFSNFMSELDGKNEKETPKIETETPIIKETVPRGSSNATISDDDFKLETVNVGQGLNLIMSCQGEVAMYDGGEYSFRMNKKYVDSRNKIWDKYPSFKYVFLSHYDSDHAGGLMDVIYNKDIGKFIKPRYRAYTKTYSNIQHALKKKKITNVKAKAKKIYKLGDAKIKILKAEKKSYDENDNSIVLKVTHGNVSYMITGDLTNYGEYQLVKYEKTKRQLSSTVLVVGHHGSGHSSSYDFIHNVEPFYSLISVGPNSYGHPDASVLTSLKSENSKIFRTDKKGTITTWDDGHTIHLKGENDE